MNFTFARKRTVASTSGRTIEFEKGVPTHVPSFMHAEVLAAGGVPEDEMEDDTPVSTKEVPAGDERIKLIREAMEAMAAANVREEFTAAGAPHNKVLTEKLGFTVGVKERDTIWADLKQGK